MEPLFKSSLKIKEKVFGPEHPDTALALNNLADLYRSMGNYARAEPLYKRSLKIKEKVFGPEHPETALALGNLAFLYDNMGNYAKAEPLYKRSLKIREKVLGPNHPDTALALNNLAFFYGSQNKNMESLNLFKRGLKIDEQTIRNIFTIASEEQKLVFVKKISANYEGALSLIHQKFSSNQDALGLGLNLVLSRKGVVFDAQARQMETIASSLDPKVKGLWKKMTSFRSRLAKLLQGKPANLSLEMYRLQIRELNREIENLESQLSSKSSLVAEELEQRKATTRKVSKQMPKDSVLIEFIKINDYNWTKGKWADTQIYLAFILHPNQQIKLINLGNADELDKDVEALLKKVKTIPTDMDDDRGLQVSPKTNYAENKVVLSQINASRKLHTLLWEPLDDFVGKTGSIVVSPDGILNLVPFSALQDSNGKFLIENHTITYVTSGRDLLRSGGGVKPESDLFLAANPEFDIVAKAKTLENQTIQRGRFRSAGFKVAFQPLPGTAEEARTIPGLVPGKDKRVVTGKDATEYAVLNVKRPKVLHLATHGFFLKDQEQFSLIGKRGISVEAKKLPTNYENPLVRSGLAFAGANYAAKTDTSMDGLLTALEVSGMDLHGTDLVTLSACDTGVGTVKAGEGVFGLRRAFALAGAKNLLLSLWPVEDKITAEQMHTFYKLYGKGKLPSEALREAQLKTIAQLREKFDYAPPSLWAPFILQSSGSKN